ncbi:rhomboid family intramembrane serine protease [Nocardia sp. NPDC058497]|uniref:rhomboid family intramembrane serine protease n=1 Tax=Nocardia sp. NPDC058497 TaxID=3346529 RepID=UPI003662624B
MNTVSIWRQLRRLPVTYSLITINVLAYCVQLIRPVTTDEFSTLRRGLMRDDIVYVYDGRDYPGYTEVGIDAGEWYRLITGAFLHSPPDSGLGPAHLVMNLVWIWLLGRVMEPDLGRIRFVMLYLGSAVGGGLMEYALAPEASAIGASGAVYGLMGAYFVLSLQVPQLRRDARTLLIVGVVWLVLSAQFTSWQGHLGGLLAGCVIGALYLWPLGPRRPARGTDIPAWHPDRL